jgi:hypothetical protein
VVPPPTSCTSGSSTADAIENEVHEVLAICEGDAVAALTITLIANAFLKAGSIASLPQCHPACVARLERRPWRKKLRRKIPTDDVLTAEKASVAAITLHSIHPHRG